MRRRVGLLLFLAGGIIFALLSESFSFAVQRAQEEVLKEDLQKLVESYYNQGKKYYQERDYLKAKKEFEEVLRLNPQHKAALRYIERCNKRLEKLERDKLRAEKKEAELKRRKEARLRAKQKRQEKLKKRAEEKIRRQKERKRKLEELRTKRQALKTKREEERKARRQERAKLRAKRREERLRRKEELRKRREAKLGLFIEKEKGEEGELLPPTLGERIDEEKKKRKEEEDNLLLFAERKLHLFQKEVNTFLKERLARKEAEKYFQNGKKYFKQKRYEEARKEFEKVLAIYPRHKKATKYIQKIDKLKQMLLDARPGED